MTNTLAIESLHDNLYDGLIKFKNDCKSIEEIKYGLGKAIEAINDSQIEPSLKDMIIRVFKSETRKVFPEIDVVEEHQGENEQQ